MSNFLNGIVAIISDIKLSIWYFINNEGVFGFFIGIIFTALISAFIITKNPKYIPTILRYSSAESFEKIAQQDESGTYNKSFTSFVKLYAEIRILGLMLLISFFVMVSTIVVSK